MAGLVKISSRGITRGIEVLLVDDSPTSLLVMKKRLEYHDYHVTTCASGVEALAKLRAYEGRFDIVLCDAKNGAMDGLTLLKKIRKEVNMDIPVVVISAADDPVLIKKAVVAGACDFLVKPPDDNSLRNLWQHVLRKAVTNTKQGFKNAGTADHGSDTAAMRETVWQHVADSGGDTTSREVVEKMRETVSAADTVSTGNLTSGGGAHTAARNRLFRSSSCRPPKSQTMWKGEYKRMFLDVMEDVGSERLVAKRIYRKLKSFFPGITKEQVSNQLRNCSQNSFSSKNQCQSTSSLRGVTLDAFGSSGRAQPPASDIHDRTEAAMNPIVSPSDSQLMNIAAAAVTAATAAAGKPSQLRTAHLGNSHLQAQMNRLPLPQTPTFIPDFGMDLGRAGTGDQQPLQRQHISSHAPYVPEPPRPDYNHGNLGPMANGYIPFHDGAIQGNNAKVSSSPTSSEPVSWYRGDTARVAQYYYGNIHRESSVASNNTTNAFR